MITVKNGHSSFLLNRDRSHTHPAHTYDIVIGPIADDGVTYQLRRYSMGDISMSRLIEELKNMPTG